ncbi:MAG TPA: hypothetical protein VG015_01335, partial [Candidatus Dormibacteraeota bacterium]|nr:hypothetical protein [Candidatus Dormibacteraeota bacterium]
LGRPLSGDPATLAAFLAGRISDRAALRRLVVPLGRRALVVVGDPVPSAESDLLVHEDRGAGLAQVWRVAAGQILGAAALVEPAVAADIEDLWLADVEPSVLRARLPVR